MKKQSAHLESWSHTGHVLLGKVSGNPQIADGTYVHTSKLISFNEKEKTAETLNTHYTLGEKAK